MILEQVILRDFCLFLGEQTFDLTPLPALRNSGTRTITLFGGVNGAGKTTLLDAIQLALYGPRARCSKRIGLAYDEFLRKSIHQGVNERKGACVSLSFRYASAGEEHLYEISRSWNVQGGKVREELSVFQDSIADPWQSEHWNQLVEDFFPLEVSQLFFFDAEKIRSLAEDETSSQVLGAAVKSLLGLDVAERLISDAGVLEARLAKVMEASKTQDNRRELEKDADELKVELDGLRTKRSELENTRRRTETEVQGLEEEFKAAGGKHWEARGRRKRREEELKNEVTECESRLLAVSATELPLCLLDGLLSDVERQDTRQRMVADLEAVAKILVDRDEQLLALLVEAEVSQPILQKVKKHLAKDRRSRRASADEIAPRLLLSPGDSVAPSSTSQSKALGTPCRSGDSHRPSVASRARAQKCRARSVDHAGRRGHQSISEETSRGDRAIDGPERTGEATRQTDRRTQSGLGGKESSATGNWRAGSERRIRPG